MEDHNMKHTNLLLIAALLSAALVTGCRSRGNDNLTPSTTTAPTTAPTIMPTAAPTAGTEPDTTTEPTETTAEMTTETSTNSDPSVTANTETADE